MDEKKPIIKKVRCKICKDEFAPGVLNEDGICIVCDRKIRGTD